MALNPQDLLQKAKPDIDEEKIAQVEAIIDRWLSGEFGNKTVAATKSHVARFRSVSYPDLPRLSNLSVSFLCKKYRDVGWQVDFDYRDGVDLTKPVNDANYWIEFKMKSYRSVPEGSPGAVQNWNGSY